MEISETVNVYSANDVSLFNPFKLCRMLQQNRLKAKMCLNSIVTATQKYRYLV